jgi:DNA polymerase
VIPLDCSLCSSHLTRTNVVVGSGDINSKILLVGECPGPDEDKDGVPFVGRSGKILRDSLFLLGIDTDKIYITNLVKCLPSNSLNPKEENITACSPYLLKQVECMDPQLIVTIGRLSTEFFLGKIKITQESGVLRKVGGKNILPILHPSYILRNGSTTKMLSEYVIALSNILPFYV